MDCSNVKARFAGVSRALVVVAAAAMAACQGEATYQPGSGQPASSAKELTSFAFLSANNPGLSADVEGVMAGSNISLTVPNGTLVSGLVPTLEHTGASVNPASGAARDFTSPVTSTVTAADGSAQSYTVTVVVAPSSSKAINWFAIGGTFGTITGTQIALTLPFGTNVSSLAPTLKHTGASVSPASGAVRDFTNPVTYTVTAADGSTQSYTVTVSPALSGAKAITRFALGGVLGTISGAAISVTVPFGTDLTALVPAIDHDGASVSPPSGVARDFTNPVTYAVTAADGSTASYTVIVSVSLPVTPPGSDDIDLATVTVFNSPTDVASWPITTQITQLTMQSGDVGLSFEFPAKATWPDYTPPGWDGPLQYTVWAVVKVAGQWYTSGFIQMWNGRASTGAPLLTDFAPNWAYDGRWGPMEGHAPVVGEQMGFFVTAGNARGVPFVTSLRERSNVVVVALPAGDTGVFTF